jgi:hypothetical protein
MLKKAIIAMGTIALVAVGTTMFAGFESHLIDVRAHVETATFVTPEDVDFGTTIMEQKYDFACTLTTPTGNPGPSDYTGNCLQIHLSDSFKTQTQFLDVTYKVYCEDKAPDDPHRVGPPALDGNITPFIRLFDSDPLDVNDVVDSPNGAGNGCGAVPYSTDPATLNPVQWAHGELDKGFDEVDFWDMSFFAPLCANDYNPETDPVLPSDQAGGGLIDPAFCHKGPGPDSDTYTNLGSNVKFQVIGLSVPVGTPGG